MLKSDLSKHKDSIEVVFSSMKQQNKNKPNHDLQMKEYNDELKVQAINH